MSTRPWGPWSLLVAALVLAGCASPRGIAPQAQVLPAARVGLHEAVQAPLPQAWWRGYGDPALDALVERALADAPDLKRAATRIARAEAAAGLADAQRRPQVGLDAEATRQRYPEHGLVPPPLAGATENTATLQFGASWELDVFGRQRAALDAAIGQVRAAEADAAAARQLLAAHVVHGYVQLARLLEQRGVAERALAQREDTLSLVAQRARAGIDTQVELRQAEASVPDTRQQIEALDEQAALARHALAALSAQAPDALDALVPRLGPLPVETLPAVLSGDLLARRADLVAARWRVDAAAREIDVAKAAFYPSINLVAFAGLSSIGLNRLFEAGSLQAGVGPAIHLPIFDAGRLRADLRGRTAELDGAVETYNAAVLDAVRDVADQIASMQSVERQAQQQRLAQSAAESAYDLAMQRYRAGLGSYLTVLSAETGVLAQRRQAADLKARTLDAQVALVHALGGGYRAPESSTTAPPEAARLSQAPARATPL